MTKEINATLYKTDGSSEPLVLTPQTRLDTLQKLVGGLIEVVFIVPYSDEIKGDFSNGKDLVINEEGLILDLPCNPWSSFVGKGSIWRDQVFRGDIILIEGVLP